MVVSESRTAGWSDLHRHEVGGGAPSSFVRHTFDGKRYAPKERTPGKQAPRGRETAMAYDDRDNGTSAVLVSFLLGALTGAGIALLLAPRSGRETREALGERLRDAAERSRALGDQVAEKGREAAESASRLVDRGRDILDKV